MMAILIMITGGCVQPTAERSDAGHDLRNVSADAGVYRRQALPAENKAPQLYI